MATIVIVDDSAAIRSHVRESLEKVGHHIIEAENGLEGYEKVIELKNPDLLITDYNMPGLDGILMIKKIKETLGTEKFPIFMLTTETSEALKAEGKAAGIMIWITKPFTPEKLILVVDKVLSTQKS